MKKFLSIAVGLALMIGGVKAEITFLSDPAASSATSSFAGDTASWGPQNLYDGDPTPDDIGLVPLVPGNDHASDGGSLAGGNHVVVYDYGSTVTFNAVAYAQRVGNGGTGVDKFDAINIWATDVDPGVPDFLTVGTLGAPDASIDPLNGAPDVPSGGGSNTLDFYRLPGDLSGRYVVFEFMDDGFNVFNPGGTELVLANDSDPVPDPWMTLSNTLDWGAVEDGSTEQRTITVSNVGATMNLNLTEVLLGGTDAIDFTVVSFPASIPPGGSGDIVISFTPGNGLGDYSADVTITSDDLSGADNYIPMTARVVEPIPADIILHPDPIDATASTTFGGDTFLWGPGNLFDGDPTVADLNQANIHGGDHASDGATLVANNHVVVYDMGSSITLNGFAYAQREGNGTDGVDKFESFRIWVTDVDPGVADPSLPGSLGAPGAEVTLRNTVESGAGTNILEYYETATLSGRYIIFEMIDDKNNVFNPGGHELMLTFSPSAVPAAAPVITACSTDGSDHSLTWTSTAGESYTVQASTDLVTWDVVDNAVPAGAGASTTHPFTRPAEVQFFRVFENP